MREREREISAFVALICLQQRKPFIAIRALLDLTGGGSSDSNKANTYHYGQHGKLQMTIIFFRIFKRVGFFVFSKIG